MLITTERKNHTTGESVVTGFDERGLCAALRTKVGLCSLRADNDPDGLRVADALVADWRARGDEMRICCFNPRPPITTGESRRFQ